MSVAATLAASETVHTSVQTYALGDFGSGRIGATVAAFVGLAAAVVGALALARASGRVRPGRNAGTGTPTGRNGAVTALFAGLVSASLGLLVVVTAEGGLGTGNGLGGGIVALIVGVAAMGLGGLALARSRRAPRQSA
ncbi:DUF6223 family protein [Yinghuangia soli]|uniref:DUF6223 family protein n=1 Tax=Yinghuangia soli TaxID=2908204 RepID=A0AA41Q088_9ACTN|nr:DUF6223 family protein [Yinghuangia soli]MCF2529178.1 DUF6223 family protein [Yinghuangia soli]